MKTRPCLSILTLASLLCTGSAQAGNPQIEPFVKWLLEDGERLEEVRFAEVAEAVSGRRVLPVDPSDPVDAVLLAHLESALDGMLRALADPEKPIHSVGRVNEISRHLEDFLLERLGEGDAFECSIPLNASGKVQRSGYPDLRLVHRSSGRVFYIDPKVYKRGSEDSSFRTFYFEPKGATNKLLDDASHLIVGVAHGGKVEGRWRLESWKLVDLIDFRVRLKAEFQSNNRELYKDASVLLESDRSGRSAE